MHFCHATKQAITFLNIFPLVLCFTIVGSIMGSNESDTSSSESPSETDFSESDYERLERLHRELIDTQVAFDNIDPEGIFSRNMICDVHFVFYKTFSNIIFCVLFYNFIKYFIIFKICKLIKL